MSYNLPKRLNNLFNMLILFFNMLFLAPNSPHNPK